MLHGLHIFLGGLRCIIVWVVQLVPCEKLGGRVAVGTSSTRSNLLHELWIDLAIADRLHHGQMLEVVMRLEEGIACEEFNKNASYAPDVTGEAPTKLKDDLRCSVVSRRDHRRMVLVVEGCRTKVYQANLAVQKNSSLPRCPRGCV